MAGIDFGTDNIAAIVTTDRASRVYKGGAVLANNRLFHKEKAKAVGILTKGNAMPEHPPGTLISSMKHDGVRARRGSQNLSRYCPLLKGTPGRHPRDRFKPALKAADRDRGCEQPELYVCPAYPAALDDHIQGRAAGIRVIVQEESYASKADVIFRG